MATRSLRLLALHLTCVLAAGISILPARASSGASPRASEQVAPADSLADPAPAGPESGEPAPPEHIFPLDPVVITAPRVVRSPTHPVASLSILPAQEIRSRNAVRPSEMVEILPNVGLEGTVKGAFRSPAIRGLGAAENLVLFDGVPVNSAFGNWGNLVSLPAPRLQRIEVIRGPGTTTFGPNVLGGVVNILTETPSPHATARLRVRRGEFGAHHYGLAVGTRVAGGGTSLELLRSGGREAAANSDWEANTLSGAIRLDGASTSLSAGGSYADAEMGVPLDPAQPQRYDYFRTYRGYLSANRSLGRRIFLASQAYAAAERSRLVTYADPTFSRETGAVITTSPTIGGEAVATLSPAHWNVVSVGLQGRNDRGTSENLGGSRGATLLGAFIQQTLRWREIGTVSAAARLDRHSLVPGSPMQGSVGATLRPFPRTRGALKGSVVQLAYGSAGRFPALRELYLSAPAPGRGNPDLERESSRTAEAGIQVPLGLSGRGEIHYFHTTADNLIERNLTLRPWVFENRARVGMSGWEIETRWRPVRPVEMVLLGSTLRAVEKSTGQPLNFRPEARGMLGLRLDLRGTRLSLTARGVGEQHYATTDPATRLPATRTLVPYGLLEAKVERRLGRWGTLAVAVDNLTDTSYSIEGHQQSQPLLPGSRRAATVDYEATLPW